MLALAGTAIEAAQADERSLYLFYTHTGETARITFWRNGRFDQRGIDQLNHFLRDWRRNETADMDPNLFNLLWQVYDEVDATEPIHVVSAYRAPETNAMLRSRSGAVAENSRHIQGMAMDFFIPGVPLAELRAVAMKHQVGGVGYYPSSGSPFVHLDTGNVRAWPRMTRAQLQQIFPDGRTLHLPADGTPLSQEGRQYAQAEWTRCHQVPCSSRPSGGDDSRIQVASAGNTGERRSILDIFRGNNATEEVAEAPAARNVTSQPVLVAPVPPIRPGGEIQLASLDVADAPVPPIKPASIELSTLAAPITSFASGETDTIAVASLQPEISDTPAQGLRAGGADSNLFAAYAPVGTPASSPQQAVQALIEQRLSAEEPASAWSRQDFLLASWDAVGTPDASAQQALDMLLNPQPAAPAQPMVTASFLPQADIGALILGLFPALAAQPMPAEIAAVPVEAADFRTPDLIAPDLEHGLGLLIDPSPVNGSHFAELLPPDVADFAPQTELGSRTGSFSYGSPNPRTASQFGAGQALHLAQR